MRSEDVFDINVLKNCLLRGCSEWLLLKSQRVSVGEDVEKRESSVTLENSVEIPQKVRKMTTLRPCNSNPGHLSESWPGGSVGGSSCVYTEGYTLGFLGN